MSTTIVTREQAEDVLAAVRKEFGDDAALYEPGFHCGGWSIALEGDYEWPVAFTHRHREEFPDLYLEPVNGWALGVYAPFSF